MEQFRVQEQRFAVLRERLEYGVYHVVENLTIEGYTSAEPLSFADRFQGTYRVYQPGEHWGDLFDCGWFHFTGQIPACAAGKQLAVLVDLSAEGLIVDKNGDAVQGMTSATSRNEFPLGLWGKRTIEIQDCLNDRGEIDFWGDFTCMDIEGQYRNGGRVKEACMVWVDTDVRDCFYDWVVCQSLFVGLCENGDAYGEEVGQILERAAALLEEDPAEIDLSAASDTEALMMGRHEYGKTAGIDKAGERISIWPDPETEPTKKWQHILDRDTILQVREILQEILSRKNDGSTMQYSSIGHSHLDLLFLWPERETPRKCARTMSTVLKMMDRFPEYKFTLSQVPVYIWLKAQYPKLYEKLVQRIREGRLEVVGALYIECDTNLPGAEALVRQLLYGKRFFQQEFGLDMQVGFLPDVFGYSAALPQLFIKAGVPYFTTNKLSMNDTNRFPRYTFWWYGLDGTKILTHMLPENSYTSAAVPQMAIYGEYHYTDKAVCPDGLQLYGLGDGGGGPGYEHMERRRRGRDLKGTPPIRDEFVVDFFKRIAKNSESYPSWHGELYFERHQGTYTSIARQKKWNRTLEQDLHKLELLASMAGEDYPSAWLYAAWQDVLLYQFHDCLPGSAIDRVYAETQARYQVLHQQARQQIDRYLQMLGGALCADGMEKPLFVMNPAPVARQETLKTENGILSISLAPYEGRLVDLAQARPAAADITDPMVMENDFVSIHFLPDGTVDSIYHKPTYRQLLPQGQRGNVLTLYADENTHWDIEKAYLQRQGVQATLLGLERKDDGMHLHFRVGASEIWQVVNLDAHSSRLSFATQVDWQEEYQMLRVSWPVDVVALEAACDIQFGHVMRPTHRNTTWDQAKFEVCAHKWADLSDRSGGMALLSDCKYGYKIWDSVLDLCLLRSQNCPCEHGDLGSHSFTYAVYPHGQDLWDGGVIREGYRLNYPVEQMPVSGSGTAHMLLPPATVVSGTVLMENIKKAEDSDALVLRLYEAAGGSCLADIQLHGYEALGLCDLMEQPIDSDCLTRTEQGVKLRFHPFEVHSLLLQKIKE